jgi:hypothetical protein
MASHRRGSLGGARVAGRSPLLERLCQDGLADTQSQVRPGAPRARVPHAARPAPQTTFDPLVLWLAELKEQINDSRLVNLVIADGGRPRRCPKRVSWRPTRGAGARGASERLALLLRLVAPALASPSEDLGATAAALLADIARVRPRCALAPRCFERSTAPAQCLEGSPELRESAWRWFAEIGVHGPADGRSPPADLTRVRLHGQALTGATA